MSFVCVSLDVEYASAFDVTALTSGAFGYRVWALVLGFVRGLGFGLDGRINLRV